MPVRRAFRRLRRVTLALIALLMIGMAWYAWEVHVPDPLQKGEDGFYPVPMPGMKGMREY